VDDEEAMDLSPHHPVGDLVDRCILLHRKDRWHHDVSDGGLRTLPKSAQRLVFPHIRVPQIECRWRLPLGLVCGLR
jgi:hypothetical protein